VGIGIMVVDRVHRTPRILGGDEKGILREVAGGEPVRTAVGGVVLNHLGWAAALGLKTGIFGRQADDEGGRFLRAAMDRFGIERDLVLDGSASSVAEIFVDDAGGRAIYMAPGATAETTAEQIRRDHADFIRRARRMTTEVSQLPLGAAREALAVAREAGIPTVVDLDVPPSDALVGLGSEAELFEVLGAASLLKPSKAAARELVPEAAADAIALARAVRSRFGNEAVVVTDGEAGCAIAAEGFEGRVRAETVRALDTTGAGDAFLGGLLVGLHHGLAWGDAGRLANACGAACAEKLGAFPDDAAAAHARVLELYGGPPLRLAPPPRDRGPVAAATS
jgi:sugar/nucleoside kinase (ribokinase family)